MKEIDNLLMKASEEGDLETVKFTIEFGHGVDVNAKDDCGWTPLYFAAFHGHLAIVKFLIENDAGINVKDYCGCTALIGASYNGRLEVVKYLVEHGAEVNVKNKAGHTALYDAIDNDHTEIADYLKSVSERRKYSLKEFTDHINQLEDK